MAGSATPKILFPRRFSSSLSIRLISRATSATCILAPALGVPSAEMPYNSRMRNIRPSPSTAYQPTEKGLAYPQSNPR